MKTGLIRKMFVCVTFVNTMWRLLEDIHHQVSQSALAHNLHLLCVCCFKSVLSPLWRHQSWWNDGWILNLLWTSKHVHNYICAVNMRNLRSTNFSLFLCLIDVFPLWLHMGLTIQDVTSHFTCARSADRHLKKTKIPSTDFLLLCQFLLHTHLRTG